MQLVMIYILQIDTSGNESAVAVSGDGTLLGLARRTGMRDHASAIHGMTNEALGAAGISFGQLKAVAVCAGPGSYTGLRIGLAVAKGFCYALDIPLLMQHKLLLLANQNRETGSESIYMAVLRARTDEYFAACYDTALRPVWPPQHRMQETVAEWLKQSVKQVILITDIENPEQEFGLPEGTAHIPVEGLDPVSWSLFAHQAFLDNKTTDLRAAEPFYMKDVFINKKL